MTISYPRAMPASGPANQEFGIQRVDFTAPEASGRVGGVQAGFPLWLATWTLGRITRASTDEWTAWLDSLRGAQRTFLGRDYSRPYPREHIDGFAGMTRAGGGSFDGSATGWSQAIDANKDARITLTGLPAGLTLSYRDYIGFRWSGDTRRTLARVTDPGTANGSGTITIGVEPPVPSWLAGGVIAHLDFPACVMRLVPEGGKAAAIDRRQVIQGTKISAIQDLRP